MVHVVRHVSVEAGVSGVICHMLLRTSHTSPCYPHPSSSLDLKPNYWGSTTPTKKDNCLPQIYADVCGPAVGVLTRIGNVCVGMVLCVCVCVCVCVYVCVCGYPGLYMCSSSVRACLYACVSGLCVGIYGCICTTRAGACAWLPVCKYTPATQLNTYMGTTPLNEP